LFLYEKRSIFAKNIRGNIIMQIITLTTDWGLKDQFIGQVKGLLYSTINNVVVVDISHNLDKYDVNSSAFIVKNACLNFPEGTIHIIDVNSYEDKNTSFLVVKAKGQYYICTDNGLPDLVFNGLEKEITTINMYSESNYYTFAVLDLFCKVAKYISEAKTLNGIGDKKEDFNKKSIYSHPAILGNKIICTIIHVDSYGNVYLNIKEDEFDKILKGRKFRINIKGVCVIKSKSQSYQDVRNIGDVLLTVSATNNLQLALREANFSNLLGFNMNDQISIDIEE
jgi:S-adenosylmethionine hydrolase